MSDSDKNNNIPFRTVSFFPFSIVFPIFCIAFSGCMEDGCQGALNAQSKAVHDAVIAGGWIADIDNNSPLE